MNFRPLSILLLVCAIVTSCGAVSGVAKHYFKSDPPAGELEGYTFENKRVVYGIGELSDDWQKLGVEEGDLAFLNEGAKSTINVNSSCGLDPGYSLVSLSDSLSIGIGEKVTSERTMVTVAGKEALRTTFIGKLNGTPLSFRTIVARDGACVFDFTFTSSRATFDAGVVQFDEFMEGFRVIRIK